MPAAATQLFDTYAHTARHRPSLLFAAAGLVLGAAVWSFVATVQANTAKSAVEPLYPSVAPVVSIMDVPNLAVLEVIRKLPMASRFDTLLANTGVRQHLTGAGPYTIFVPANNYFDYLPKGAYVSLTRAQELELAQHMVVSNAAIGTDAQDGQYITLAQDVLPVELTGGAVLVGGRLPAGGQGFAMRGYRATNGIVYVINRVLAPDELKLALQVP